ncbi:hypothetical protein IVA88_16695 [Bradyrhizobium sp. 149]|uniref:hypothetical protein n=1 Tax=Bradyrhizobium sp. 149 TaxID=2782624 RepID=UPI001FF8290D|nr:hypothetical protein [Bradyrhizobium sp. 149]MCK1653058.1 hypothetical protein [Bradyrhizobium sp. 149]
MTTYDPNTMPFSGVNAHDRGDLAMRKLQLEARDTVINGTPTITTWQPTAIDLSDRNARTNSREPVKVDPQTNPARGFVKHPDMPTPANLKDIKVNL